MNTIYTQHEKAFANVSAYVIMFGGELLARVNIKYGATVHAYVHAAGTSMVKGTASGGGYDRTSTAVIRAASKIVPVSPHSGEEFADVATLVTVMRNAPDGLDWETVLRNAGYNIIQAI